ncbi:MAG: endo-1,4-beta-xylanase [Defluviitaleaceae bacterium]|nr:endo-1,4-beta-xylanase [Defluviitaleaceae bacterium]
MKKRIISTFLSFIIIFGTLQIQTFANSNIVFSLRDYITEIGNFNFPDNLQQSGSPNFEIIEHNGENVLLISGRTANWNGIDILRDGLYIGDTIEITGYVINAPQDTQVILGGAESPWNWANNMTAVGNENFTLNLNLGQNHFEEEQFVRFRIQTNDEGANTDIIIQNISILRTEDSVPHAWTVATPSTPIISTQAEDRILIFDIAGYDYIQTDGLTNFVGSNYLTDSGNPTITRVNGSLQFTNRTENWHTIDILLQNLNLGNTYLFTANGTANSGMEIGFHRSDAPWNFIGNSMVATDTNGNWQIEAVIDYPVNPAMPAVRIQTNNAETEDFTIDSIRIYQIGSASLNFETLYNINNSNFADFENYLSAGSQMTGNITEQGFRLENITGDYTSGNGNYLRFDLPNPIAPSTDLRISWDVYVPSNENDGDRNLVGPGLVINSNFGQPPSQPTNNIDLNRTIQMDEWVNTSIEFALSHEVGDAAEHLIFRFRVNNNEQQPTVLYINNINIEYGGVADFIPPEWDLNLPSLSEAFLPFFTVGNIYPTHAIMNQFDTRSAFIHHFNAVTAENWHKPDHIAGPAGSFVRPNASDFNFSSADAIVDWAVENNIKLVGHAFIWHNQTPNWLFWESDGVPHTRDDARENMQFYISTLANHYRERGNLGAFYSWDVVNEAIASGGGTWGSDLNDFTGGDWRTQMRETSPWFMAYANGYNPDAGEHPSDFIYDAFVFARRYFPYSILYYNDYNEEIPAKRNAIAQMIEQINERWQHDTVNNPEAVPVDMPYSGRLLIEAMGMQSHFHLPMGGWSTNFDNIRPAIERFSQTGVILAATEIDITVGAHGTGAISFADLPQNYANLQAEAYARIFGYYLEFANYIERVSIWGLSDTQSWRAAGHPLLFDANFTAKPAFFSILEVLENFETSNLNIETVTINNTTLPNANLNQIYSNRIDFSRKNNSPILWTISEGNLPDGLILHSRTGVIEGRPTTSGTFNFRVEAKNYGGTSEREFNLTVISPNQDVNIPINENREIVTIIINDENTFESNAYIHEQEIFIPLRRIMENLGAMLIWEEGTRTIYVTLNNETSTIIPNLVVDTNIQSFIYNDITYINTNYLNLFNLSVEVSYIHPVVITISN